MTDTSDRFDRFLREVDSHLTLDPAERKQVLGELRSHLAETASEMQIVDPDRSVDDIQAQVVDDFGAPADLALAYNPRGSVVLTDASGATVLTFSAAVTKAGKMAGEVARSGARAVGRGAEAVGRSAGAVGRGAGRAVKIGFLSFVVLLGVALLSGTIVAVVLFDDIRDIVESNVDEHLYSSSVDCRNLNCSGARGSTSFYLFEGAKGLTYDFDLHAAEANATGTALLQIYDPSGRLVLNRTFDATGEHRNIERGDFQPAPGYWEVRLVFAGYNGQASIDVWATGLPR